MTSSTMNSSTMSSSTIAELSREVFDDEFFDDELFDDCWTLSQPCTLRRWDLRRWTLRRWALRRLLNSAVLSVAVFKLLRNFEVCLSLQFLQLKQKPSKSWWPRWLLRYSLRTLLWHCQQPRWTRWLKSFTQPFSRQLFDSRTCLRRRRRSRLEASDFVFAALAAASDSAFFVWPVVGAPPVWWTNKGLHQLGDVLDWTISLRELVREFNSNSNSILNSNWKMASSTVLLLTCARPVNISRTSLRNNSTNQSRFWSCP
jgi:hypothetical protein